MYGKYGDYSISANIAGSDTLGLDPVAICKLVDDEVMSVIAEIVKWINFQLICITLQQVFFRVYHPPIKASQELQIRYGK